MRPEESEKVLPGGQWGGEWVKTGMVIMNTNFTEHGDMVKSRTVYHYVDKRQSKCHGLVFISTGFNTGSKARWVRLWGEHGADWSL